MRYLITLPLLLFIVTGCRTVYHAPGATGRVVDAQTGTPVLGAQITRLATHSPDDFLHFFDTPTATVFSDKKGVFNLPPDSTTYIDIGYHGANPDSMSGSFIVSANGYVTNQLYGTATSYTFWRAELGKIMLKKP